jgi:hypothetical protein
VPAAQIQASPTPASAPLAPRRTPVDITDPLSEQKGWLARDDDEGSCLFRDDRMFVTLKHLGHALCRGPDTPLVGDQLIAVDVIRESVDECGSIFFLIDEAGSFYELVTCGDRLVINRDDHEAESLVLVGAFNLADPLPVGKPVRVEVRLTGFRLAISLAGRDVGEMLLDSEKVKKGGEVTLGIFGDSRKRQPFSVSFARFEARTLR